MSDKIDRGARVNEAVLEALNAPRKSAASAGSMAAPRTWIGRVAEEHNTGLKGRIQELESERSAGLVVLRIDPKRIRLTELANRHALSLDGSDTDFIALKADIAQRGQLEPIRVRPAAHAQGVFEYELVYGHRRHAACLALDAETAEGFPVLALLDAQAADARDHVLKMYQENAARKDLSAFEIGRMFRGWLDARVFSEQNEIAEATGLGKQTVSKYLQVAALPDPIIAAFRDPRVIAVRWAESLMAALRQNAAAVLGAAKRLAEQADAPAELVLRTLLDAAVKRKTTRGGSQSETIKIDGRTAFAYSLKNERIAIRFGKHVEPQVAKELTGEIKELLTRRLKAKLGRAGSR